MEENGDALIFGDNLFVATVDVYFPSYVVVGVVGFLLVSSFALLL